MSNRPGPLLLINLAHGEAPTAPKSRPRVPANASRLGIRPKASRRSRYIPKRQVKQGPLREAHVTGVRVLGANPSEPGSPCEDWEYCVKLQVDVIFPETGQRSTCTMSQCIFSRATGDLHLPDNRFGPFAVRGHPQIYLHYTEEEAALSYVADIVAQEVEDQRVLARAIYGKPSALVRSL